MLVHKLLEAEGILVLTPQAPLTSDDFQGLAAEVDPYIESKGNLQGILIEAESFPGWHDFGSFVSHVQFVRNHHRHVKKIAAVSDSEFLTIAPKIASHFVQAEVRHFAFGDREAAMTWLKE
ncbi:hypothetical protein Pan258_60610 [Symmachiella dynata]|uniref:STAS/SEC14 domain-containing protein n=1 Tax=Symmachiella dynata TaxID=2527995 RepID=UPI00118C23AF|nr:STAS/SEC14 domain-containing protein [Symmachiella dynata]QDT51964.1 hypothetical protein Pan258_60610 [Symmachiella dynata]